MVQTASSYQVLFRQLGECGEDPDMDRPVSVYVLVAIIKKRLNLGALLYEMLQILEPHHV